MPDLQNKQGEPNLTQTFDARIWTQEWLKIIAEHPGIPTDEGTMISWFSNAIMAGYDHAKRESLPSQQPAPPKGVEERIASLTKLAADEIYKSDNLWRDIPFRHRENIEKAVGYALTELATELTKDREELENEHDKWKRRAEEKQKPVRALGENLEATRQQLAEAKEASSRMMKDRDKHYDEAESLRAQNIALSAVVERHRELFRQFDERWCPHTDIYDYLQQVRELSRDALALQPDLSLYNRITSTLTELDKQIAILFWSSDDGENIRDGRPEDSDAPPAFCEAWSKLRQPNLKNLRLLCEKLNVSSDYLLDLT